MSISGNRGRFATAEAFPVYWWHHRTLLSSSDRPTANMSSLLGRVVCWSEQITNWFNFNWSIAVNWAFRYGSWGQRPVPVAARSKAWVYGRSPAEIVGSNPTGGHGCLSVANVLCCQVEVSATSWSLVQRSPTNCGASLCVIQTSWIIKPWPIGGYRTKNKQRRTDTHMCMKIYYKPRVPATCLDHPQTGVSQRKNTSRYYSSLLTNAQIWNDELRRG